MLYLDKLIKTETAGVEFYMSNIFISWSKAKSRDFAIETKNLLESLDPHVNVFMSEENISAGEKVQEKSSEKLESVIYCCFVLHERIKNLRGYYMKQVLHVV